MSTKNKNSKNQEEVVELTGSSKVKNLQEKQIESLTKVHDSLNKTFAKISLEYANSIEEARKELVDLYYDIQEKEQYLKELEKTSLDRIAKNETENHEQFQQKLLQQTKKLDNLKNEYDLKKREFDIDFNLQVKADKERVAISLLEELNWAKVSKKEFNKLVADQAELSRKFEAGYEESIQATERRLTSKYESKLKSQQLTFEKDQAEMAAEVKALKAQITRMENDAIKSEERLNNVLENQVRMAEASKSVVVNAGKEK